MTTIRELITDSLELIEVVGAGEAPTAEDAATMLRTLIKMLDNWSIDGNKVFTETKETFPLTANDEDYTIGSGGDFSTTQPLRILGATVELSGGPSTSLEILSAEDYAAREDKNLSGLPFGVWFKRGYPLGTLIFYNKPSQAYTLKLYSEKPLSSYTSINDTFVGPPGWEQAITYNLAVLVAPKFGKSASPDVKSEAISSKSAIEAQISSNKPNTMQVDDALLCNGGFNIMVGR